MLNLKTMGDHMDQPLRKLIWTVGCGAISVLLAINAFFVKELVESVMITQIKVAALEQKVSDLKDTIEYRFTRTERETYERTEENVDGYRVESCASSDQRRGDSSI